MLAIKRVLVPVDFSEASEKAVRYGLSLAVELSASLVLEHIVPSPAALTYAFPMETRAPTPEQMSEMRARLETLIDIDYRRSIPTECIVKVGDVADELIAATASADLTVMGTHGRRRFKRWILGSVTESLLRRIHIPILTVAHLDPEHEMKSVGPVPLRKLLYATDLSPAAGDATGSVIAFAAEFSAELIILHVMPEPGWSYGVEVVPLDIETRTSEFRKGLIRRLETSVPEPARSDPRVRTELVAGVPHETILRVADQERADMIVLNLQSKAGLERALLGSTAERVVRSSHLPVLSIPAARAREATA